MVKRIKLVCISIALIVQAIYPVSSDYRIAFVKQVVYQDLYCASSHASKPEIIFSSYLRSGPVALFTKLNADFYIVDAEPDPECQIWKEKAKMRGEAHYKSLCTTIPPAGIAVGHNHPQGYYSVKSNQIDWGTYDIVITMECAIPARLTKQCPQTLWAYYVGEGWVPSYKRSFNKVMQGYDCFLSQNFQENPKHRNHVIEFPYQLQYYGCFHELFGLKTDKIKREGIYFEHHTGIHYMDDFRRAQLEKVVPIKKKSCKYYANNVIPLKDTIQDLLSTKYFVIYLERTGPRTGLRGNAVIEAIAAGNLAIARDLGIANKSLFTKRTLINSFDELIERLKYFEQNPQIYEEELSLQRKKLNLYCFERPLDHLFQLCSQKKLKNG